MSEMERILSWYLLTGVSRSQGGVICGDLGSTVPRGLGGMAISSSALSSPSVGGACSSVRSVKFA